VTLSSLEKDDPKTAALKKKLSKSFSVPKLSPELMKRVNTIRSDYS